MDELARFEDVVNQPESQIDLAEAAMLIGAAADPVMELAGWLAELDRLARGIRDLDGLRVRCFREMGLRGDTRDYYDPENSFLHRVITRRVGIPITLSVLIIEIGRRAGIRLNAVGMPGHFLVGIPGRARYIDAFSGGGLLDLAGCEARFREATGSGPEVAFGPHLLPTVGPRAVLARMLANLRTVYEARRSGAELEWVARMSLALPGAAAPEALVLASALELQGRFLEAARELETRARADPGDGAELKAAAHRLRSKFN